MTSAVFRFDINGPDHASRARTGLSGSNAMEFALPSPPLRFFLCSGRQGNFCARPDHRPRAPPRRYRPRARPERQLHAAPRSRDGVRPGLPPPVLGGCAWDHDRTKSPRHRHGHLFAWAHSGRNAQHTKSTALNSRWRGYSGSFPVSGMNHRSVALDGVGRIPAHRAWVGSSSRGRGVGTAERQRAASSVHRTRSRCCVGERAANAGDHTRGRSVVAQNSDYSRARASTA